jgi:hypothetical protein
MSQKLSHSEAGKLGYLKTKDKIDAYYLAIRTKYNNNPKKCKLCGKILDWEHRRNIYCNHSCAKKDLSTFKKLNYQNLKHYTCPNCGKLIPYTKNTRKWCSHKCQLIYTFRYNRDHNISIMHKAVRTYLLLTREYKCNDCKLSTWKNKPIPLEAHHKDGDHNNNSEENLELICPNCHSLTDNYKSKNKGNGRPKRRVTDGNRTH